jgi:hypothetical protein
VLTGKKTWPCCSSRKEINRSSWIHLLSSTEDKTTDILRCNPHGKMGKTFQEDIKYEARQCSISTLHIRGSRLHIQIFSEDEVQDVIGNLKDKKAAGQMACTMSTSRPPRCSY